MIVIQFDSDSSNQSILFPYLYNEVGWGDVARQGGEVEPHTTLLVGWEFGIILIIQGDAGQRSSDGCWVTGVHLLEYDWKDKQRRGKCKRIEEASRSSGNW